MIEERNPQIGKAAVKLRRLSADEQTRYDFERREKARMDMEMWKRWAMQEGRQEGMQKGRQEGLQKGRQEGELSRAFDIARNLLGVGDSIDKIIKVTGLSRKDVESLRQ